jgi:hypothetical protein
MLGFKKPQNAGKTLLAVGPNLVKLFSMVNSKYLAATPVARKARSVALHKCVLLSKSHASPNRDG